ncbi:MAG: hypothetical protein QOE35_789 [Actinomycetota bacterium]
MKRSWSVFRGWPFAGQVISGLVAFFLLAGVASAAAGPPKPTPAKVSTFVATTLPRPTTTEYIAPTTTTEAPTTTTAAPTTTTREYTPPTTEYSPPTTAYRAPVYSPPPTYTPPTTAGSSVYYANCDDARAHGAAPIYQGQPGYRPGLDRDGDGIACE